jgi:hypothetical protein
MSLNHLPEPVRSAVEAEKRKLLKYFNFADTKNLSHLACLFYPKAKSDVLKVSLSAHSVSVIIGQAMELLELYSASLPNPEVVGIPRTFTVPKTKKIKSFTRFLSNIYEVGRYHH